MELYELKIEYISFSVRSVEMRVIVIHTRIRSKTWSYLSWLKAILKKLPDLCTRSEGRMRSNLYISEENIFHVKKK